ncbi:hypothetical protein [Paenibacillus polymyxa]|uniref:hypothetical protein n=1 Tax=Paenibacillus polymyxa TaxID=1406 RepID=UPI0001E6C124|nr:hypothetical protein [Paenibacillus polymyxa]WPQ59794.1 hypothetical protein SKN87_26255 [Paenibacillus polymyxa]
MTVYFHLSTLLSHEGAFVPRVPENQIHGIKESTIKRVCVSKTIEGCFTAIGNGQNPHDANFVRRGYYVLFKIDTEKLGIEKRHIVSSRQIYRNGWVPDADVTKEHWITKSFQVPKEEMSYIQIQSFKQVQTMAYPYEVVNLARNGDQGNVESIYKKRYSNPLPCVRETVSLNYQTSKGLTGKERFMFVQGEEEKETVIDFLTKNYKVELLDRCKDKIHFRLLEDKELLPLFLTNLIASWTNTDDDNRVWHVLKNTFYKVLTCKRYKIIKRIEFICYML